MHKSEKEFADFLTRQGKTYVYEPKTFKLNGKKYRPDFYCPEDDVYYEVKVNLTHGDIVKMLEFKAKYHDLKLKVVSPNGHSFYSTSSGRYLASLEEKMNFIKSTDVLDISLKEFDKYITEFHKHDIGRSRNKILTTPHALMRGIPHPHGLGFLLHGQNQCPDSAGLKSHLSDGTVLQIQKPVTNNSLAK